MQNNAELKKPKNGLERPTVNVEHLMTNFDNFYEQVVSTQLIKDKLSVKKKYANMSGLGEGE